MKILFYIQRFDRYSGGLENQAAQLSGYFSARGSATQVLTYNFEPEPASKPGYGIISFRVSSLPLLSTFLSFVYGLLFLLFRAEKYDLIISFLSSSNSVLSGVFGKIYKIPVLVRAGGSRETGDIGASRKTISGRLKLKILKNTVTGYIAPSREIKDELAASGFDENRISVINNGVDPELFRPVSEEKKKEIRKKLALPDKRTVLYAGRFHINKRIDQLLEVFCAIKKDTCLVLAGDGEERSRLIALYGADKRLIFTGNVKNMPDYYSAADIFVLPSCGEGMSNVLLEAMSSGMICIATRIGGNDEIIQDGKNGFLYKPGDRKKLAELLELSLSGGQDLNNIASEARNSVLNNFAFKSSAEKYFLLSGETIKNYRHK